MINSRTLTRWALLKAQAQLATTLRALNLRLQTRQDTVQRDHPQAQAAKSRPWIPGMQPARPMLDKAMLPKMKSPRLRTHRRLRMA